MKKLLCLGMVLVLAAALAGCGGSETLYVSGPGLVGIDDTTEDTAPLLTVTFRVPPSTDLVTVNILSDRLSDGDIAFNPFFNTYTVTSGPAEFLFGFDSNDIDIPEYRGFLTFPLDGFTGQGVVPSNAVIVDAVLEVVVTRAEFASVIPTFLDLVQYPFRGLSAQDFDTALLDFRTLNFYSNDLYVPIDVTPLMQTAQAIPGLTDFQVRFIVDSGGTLAPSRAPSADVRRSVRTGPRTMDNIVPNRGPSASQPVSPADQAARRR